MAAGRYLTGAWRTLSSAFTLDPSGERFAFARFRGGDDAGPAGSGRRSVASDRNATELAELQSNGATTQRKDEAAESGKDGGGFFPAEDHTYHGSGGELKQDRNRISAWQAGWNVTNAIQVLIVTIIMQQVAVVVVIVVSVIMMQLCSTGSATYWIYGCLANEKRVYFAVRKYNVATL